MCAACVHCSLSLSLSLSSLYLAEPAITNVGLCYPLESQRVCFVWRPKAISNKETQNQDLFHVLGSATGYESPTQNSFSPTEDAFLLFFPRVCRPPLSLCAGGAAGAGRSRGPRGPARPRRAPAPAAPSSSAWGHGGRAGERRRGVGLRGLPPPASSHGAWPPSSGRMAMAPSSWPSCSGAQRRRGRPAAPAVWSGGEASGCGRRAS